MLKIKKGNKVIVLAGADKGKQGSVLMIKDGKAIVSNLNLKTHFVKRNPQKDEEGGIRKKEAAIQLSNLALYDEKTGKPIKVKFEIRDGKKVRVNKKTNEVIDS
jgi:large subunit ribosomal protein L24